MGIQLNLKQSAPVEEEARKKFKDAFDTALLELADHLQQESPRGVSGSSDSLAGSWNVIPAKKERGLIPVVGGKVVNTADAAEFRIRGRGPGAKPPISKIESWAIAVGMNPYALQQSIANRGTMRWRSKRNILDQDPITLQYGKNSPVYTVFEPTLRREWDRIKI
jgi:hypothetical protein